MRWTRSEREVQMFILFVFLLPTVIEIITRDLYFCDACNPYLCIQPKKCAKKTNVGERYPLHFPKKHAKKLLSSIILSCLAKSVIVRYAPSSFEKLGASREILDVNISAFTDRSRHHAIRIGAKALNYTQT